MSGYINIELIPKIPWFKVNKPDFSYDNKAYSCTTLHFNDINDLNTPTRIRMISTIITTPPIPTTPPRSTRSIINPILELEL